MKTQEYTAKTVEAAIEEGLNDLGITKEQAEIEELAKGGLFSKARVRITVKETPGTKAQAFLARVLELMQVEAEVKLDDSREEAVLEIVGDDSKKLLRRSGEAIDALQYLSSIVANADETEYRRVVLDSENYRKMRQERLEQLAETMATKAVERGYRMKLEPMNPYERRVIHTYLAEREGLTTHSEGEEPNRYVVIVPANAKARRYEPKTAEEGEAKPYRDRPRRNSDRRREDRSDSRGRSGRGDRGGRGGYGDRRDRGPRADRPPMPPRAKSTLFGTILTTPVQTPEQTDDTQE